jgi:hypothetical protein
MLGNWRKTMADSLRRTTIEIETHRIRIIRIRGRRPDIRGEQAEPTDDRPPPAAAIQKNYIKTKNKKGELIK